MKKQLRFFFFLLFVVLFAYLLRPSSEHLDKLYVVRGVSLATDYKKAVSNYLLDNKTLPGREDWETMAGSVHVDLAESAVDRITVGDDGPGTVTIYYDSSRLADAPPAINNTRVVLTPQVFGDSITWTCRGTMPQEYLPNACQ